ncbi:MAG: hypothetical protein H6981_07195 [Gammaproteobacteria bacterium]|nr:hypothetical protein [Gammaproteobacteria bacterium]
MVIPADLDTFEAIRFRLFRVAEHLFDEALMLAESHTISPRRRSDLTAQQRYAGCLGDTYFADLTAGWFVPLSAIAPVPVEVEDWESDALWQFIGECRRAEQLVEDTFALCEIVERLSDDVDCDPRIYAGVL